MEAFNDCESMNTGAEFPFANGARHTGPVSECRSEARETGLVRVSLTSLSGKP